MPSPIQIIRIDENDDYKFILNEDNLSSVLSQVPRGNLVSVVSVVGAFRTGKSFLLSWFLQYLDYLKHQKKSGNDSDSWDDVAEEMKWYESVANLAGNLGVNEVSEDVSEDFPEKNKDDGFAWRGGAERNTTGIWMWSKPLEVPNNPKLSVLLIDTQGLFDNLTTIHLTTAIFGLTTLISSYQLYNVEKRIQEDHLQHLALFVEYARLAVKSSVSKTSVDEEEEIEVDSKNASTAILTNKPFQKIEFLVRDWQNFDEVEDEGDEDTIIDFVKLEKDMADYLETVISEREAQDLKETREHIQSCFEDISCFLLPHPGIPVTKKKYTGDVKLIEPVFLKFLDRLCHHVFDNLQPKKIHGRALTAPQLSAYFTAYAAMFSKGATHFPAAGTMLDATSQANNTVAVNTCLQNYVEEMDLFVGPNVSDFRAAEAVKQRHNDIMQRSLRAFDDIATFGKEAKISEARAKVQRQITERFLTYEKLNEGRNPLAGLETFLIPTIVAITSWFMRKVSDFTCSSWSQTCKAGSDALHHIFSVAFIFLFIVYCTKAKQVNDKLKVIKSAIVASSSSKSKEQGGEERRQQQTQEIEMKSMIQH